MIVSTYRVLRLDNDSLDISCVLRLDNDSLDISCVLRLDNDSLDISCDLPRCPHQPCALCLAEICSILGVQQSRFNALVVPSMFILVPRVFALGV